MTEIPYRIERDGADVTLTLQVFAEGDDIVCGLRFLSGSLPKPTKALRHAVREELARIESLCRRSGVTEMRHAGEDRAGLLPGYEPMNHPELRNGRRKRL